MKKILLLVGSLNPGGAELRMICLANYFHSNGYSVEIGVSKKTSQFSDRLNPEIPIRELNFFGINFKGLSMLVKLLLLLKTSPPDILFTNLNKTNSIALIAKRFTRNTKVVVSVVTNPDRYRNKKFVMKFYLEADLIITVSKGIRNILIKEYKIPENMIRVIFTGVDIKRIGNKSSSSVSASVFN